MFAIPGLVLLVFLIYVRPQELDQTTKDLPVLYVAFGLALFGLLLDVRLRRTELSRTPHLPWAIALFAWAMFTVALHTPRRLPILAADLGVPVVLFLIIAHGLSGFRGLHVLGTALLCMVLFVAAIGVHQWFQPTGCVLIDEKILDTSVGTYDGRPCQTVFECYGPDAEPGARYHCEKIGLLGTTSIADGRVRYAGVLQDPNELALVTGIGIPLVFAWGRRKTALPRWLLTVLTVALVFLCGIFTGSRGGQLVVLAVFGTYFVKRFGWKGIALGVTVAAPILLFGGRSGYKAETSTIERIECWYAAMSMFRTNPLIGVGYRQFNEYHYLTAHNSYLLTLAEMGFVGLFLFSVLMYLSIKTPYRVLVAHPPAGARGALEDAAPATIARTWAMTLLASFSGLAVGTFFLSFSYHYVLWIYFGLVGALYVATRRHNPRFEVKISVRELVIIALADGLLVLSMFVFTRGAAG